MKFNIDPEDKERRKEQRCQQQLHHWHGEEENQGGEGEGVPEALAFDKAVSLVILCTLCLLLVLILGAMLCHVVCKVKIRFVTDFILSHGYYEEADTGQDDHFRSLEQEVEMERTVRRVASFLSARDLALNPSSSSAAHAGNSLRVANCDWQMRKHSV